MNQILYTGGKNNGATELKKIIRIFAIGILIYGLICLGEGCYGIAKNIEEENNRIVDPYVTLEQQEDVLVLNIKHNKAIDKIIYNWNGEENITLQGQGREEITETIAMPVGENTLEIHVLDIRGHEIVYTNSYYAESIDKTEPEIELLVEDAKVKIVAKDETALDYISYYWNDEDETRLTARLESPTTIEERISILKGENTLTIIAVDLAGNQKQVEQTYIGATKPTIELTQENNYLTIRVTDEDNIQKIEYFYGSETFSTDPDNTGEPLNLKEAACRQELHSGVNSFTIRAYNVSGLVTEEITEITL